MTRVSQGLKAAAQILEGVTVFREDEQFFVLILGGFDKLPQVGELRLLLKIHDGLAEADDPTEVFQLLLQLCPLYDIYLEEIW